MNNYPVYIVSKGRWENPQTAKLFIQDGIDFQILVEPQEYNKEVILQGIMLGKIVLRKDLKDIGCLMII